MCNIYGNVDGPMFSLKKGVFSIPPTLSQNPIWFLLCKYKVLRILKTCVFVLCKCYESLCMVTHIAREVWINRVRLPVLHVVS